MRRLRNTMDSGRKEDGGSGPLIDSPTSIDVGELAGAQLAHTTLCLVYFGKASCICCATEESALLMYGPTSAPQAGRPTFCAASRLPHARRRRWRRRCASRRLQASAARRSEWVAILGHLGPRTLANTWGGGTPGNPGGLPPDQLPCPHGLACGSLCRGPLGPGP